MREIREIKEETKGHREMDEGGAGDSGHKGEGSFEGWVLHGMVDPSIDVRERYVADNPSYNPKRHESSNAVPKTVSLSRTCYNVSSALNSTMEDAV